jgi:hypothetical protein
MPTRNGLTSCSDGIQVRMKSSYLLFLHWNKTVVTKPWVVQDTDVALGSEPGKVLMVISRVLQPRKNWVASESHGQFPAKRQTEVCT